MYVRDRERIASEILTQLPKEDQPELGIGDVMTFSVLLESDGQTRSRFRITRKDARGIKVKYIEPWMVDKRQRTDE